MINPRNKKSSSACYSLKCLSDTAFNQKRSLKRKQVTSQENHAFGKNNVHIGPSDYLAWIDDRKWAYVRLEGKTFGDVPLTLEYTLEVWDSPNSEGVIIDAVRYAELAFNRSLKRHLDSISSYLMKSPPKQENESEAKSNIEVFKLKHA